MTENEAAGTPDVESTATDSEPIKVELTHDEWCSLISAALMMHTDCVAAHKRKLLEWDDEAWAGLRSGGRKLSEAGGAPDLFDD